ncbi:MAG: choice-of-anchor D domain-containing protein [Planctomycetes bacterium]|nr:choice-of-anchor D domain-containing protein [Planctomycetota bacterium]
MQNRMAMLAVVVFAAAALSAQDYGDADISYGTMEAEQTWGGLGALWSNDLTNPVTPAWTGDNDDCVVGNPVWDSWSSYNTLTINVTEIGHLFIWVDANDNGVFAADERYVYFPGTEITQPGNYTFTNIIIKRTTNFSRNGLNKCAVRITLQDNLGGAPNFNSTGSFYFGEVEDWLIDVEPAKFVVATEAFRDATEGKPFNFNINAQNGTPPYSWNVIAGALPAGLALTPIGDQFQFSGAPAAGSGTGGQNYTFTVQVTDTASLVATRQFNLRVLPAPAALPFFDDFSNSTGWTLGATWSRGPAVGYQATGQSWDGWQAMEPAFDVSPSADNMILGDSIGSSRPDMMPQPQWAVSPVLDCTGISAVELRFSRWLSCGYYGIERVRVQVSNDGANWVDVWSNNFSFGWKNLCDFSWTPFTYDISAVAANQPRVQVRFGIGPCSYPQWLTLWGWHERFTGWCIDDFKVYEKPNTNLLVAQSFNIATNSSYFDATTQSTLPMLFPQSQHAFTAVVNNASTNAVTLTGLEVGTVQVGNSQFYGTQSSWINVGQFSLATPINVPAGASAFNVQGTLLGALVAPHLVLVPMDATIWLTGVEAGTGAIVRTQATFRFGMNGSPQPGLRVYETQIGGPQIFNGDAPVGQRDFGSVLTGSSGNWLNIVLKNNGGTPVNLSQAMLSGADAGEFTITNSGYVSPIVNQTGSYSWFSIKFSPVTPGAKQCTVSFTHDAPNTGTPFTFEISGFAVVNAPVLQVTETSATGPGISYGAAPASGRDFGNHDINAGPSAMLVIHIENTGTQNLVLGTPWLVGVDASSFGLDIAAFASTVMPGMSTEFSIYFDPAVTGAKLAQISFTHNAAGVGTPFIFDVSGFGIINAALIAVTESSGAPIGPGAAAAGGRQFAPLDVSSGASAAIAIVIRNNGWQDLLLGTPTLSGVHAASFVLDTTGMVYTLAHGQSTTFTIAFDPISKGLKTATVDLTHNDASAPTPYTFDVMGLGVDPYGVMVSTTSLPLAQATVAYSTGLQASGGTAPYGWTLVSGTLPAGLTLASDGTISGTPIADAAYSFRVRVTDALGGIEEKQLQLIVQPAPGDLSKGNTVGGGCSTSEQSAAALFVLLAGLLVLGAKRARKA